MRNKTFFINILACAAIIFAAAVSGSAQRAKAQQITGDRFNYSARTPRGAAVFSVSRPSAAVLNAIDSGLADLFAAARRNGYSRHLNYSDYSVYIGRADRTRDSTGQYSPDIAVKRTTEAMHMRHGARFGRRIRNARPGYSSPDVVVMVYRPPGFDALAGAPGTP